MNCLARASRHQKKMKNQTTPTASVPKSVSVTIRANSPKKTASVTKSSKATASAPKKSKSEQKPRRLCKPLVY